MSTFAVSVMGPNSPKGSNILDIIDNMIRFVTLL